MTWSVCFTKTFLDSLLKLPVEVTKKLPEVLKTLQDNPVNYRSKKIRSTRDIWRIYLTQSYRLFYTYKDNWVKLLRVLIRNEDTYSDVDTINSAEEAINTWFKDDVIPNDIPPETDSLISLPQLQKWQIPEEHWQDLLSIPKDSPDDLLNLDIPSIYVERILELLYPSKTLEELTEAHELYVEDYESIPRWASGQLVEFLLKLSDKQLTLVNCQSHNAILVKGGPGTGKSTVALYRVAKLVKDGIKSILFTTHNQSLIMYSESLLYSILGQKPQDVGVTVSTVDRIILSYYENVYGKPHLIDTEISLWCLNSALNVTSLRPSVKSNLQSLGTKYLLEEIVSVLEARDLDSWEKYQEVQRFGRNYPFDRRLRLAMWDIYQKWQEIVNSSGFTSMGEVRKKALQISRGRNEKEYEAVIIDEAQDLSPVALRFLASLVSEPSKLYLTADVSQSLYQRSFSWDLIQGTIRLQSESHILRKSFRNTRQIGRACGNVINNYREDLLDAPNSFSNLEGNNPKIMLTDNLGSQAKIIKEFLEASTKRHKLPIFSGIILSPDATLSRLVAQQLTFLGLKSEYLKPHQLNIAKDCIKILDLDAAKGLEFPYVVLVGLQQDIFPKMPPGIPEEECKELMAQQRRLFYVGCSRAMLSLLVCGSKSQKSQFVEDLILMRTREHYETYWEIEEI